MVRESKAFFAGAVLGLYFRPAKNKPMARNREIEVKLPVPDIARLIGRLRSIGAERIERLYEHNALFDTPDGQLRRLRSILRVRWEGSAKASATGDARPKRRPGEAREGLLTFKGPIGRSNRPSKYKEREEIEFRLRSAARFAAMLDGIGLRRWFQYEKYRTKYRVGREARLHIDLDETPIGVFLELEGSRRAIDRAAKALGYSSRDYITASYFELYAAHCSQKGLKVTNMVFPKEKMR